jgi:hypothetical protein
MYIYMYPPPLKQISCIYTGYMKYGKMQHRQQAKPDQWSKTQASSGHNPRAGAGNSHVAFSSTEASMKAALTGKMKSNANENDGCFIRNIF